MPSINDRLADAGDLLDQDDYEEPEIDPEFFQFKTPAEECSGVECDSHYDLPPDPHWIWKF